MFESTVINAQFITVNKHTVNKIYTQNRMKTIIYKRYSSVSEGQIVWIIIVCYKSNIEVSISGQYCFLPVNLSIQCDL